MAGADVILRGVPDDANPRDVRLRDPSFAETVPAATYRPKLYGVFREGLYARALPRKLYLTYGGDPAAGGGVTIEVTLTVETDSAFGVTSAKTLAAGLATETDSALALVAAKALAAGLATETDSAFGITWRRSRTAGLATETDTALAAVAVKAVGIASETDSALAAARVKARAAGLATETDSAFGVTWSRSRPVGLNTESDSALAAALLKARAAGLTAETDAVLAATWRKAKVAGLADETDAALAVTEFVLSNLHPLYRPQRYGVFRTGLYARITPRRLYYFGIVDADNTSLLVDFATPTQDLAPGLVQRFRVLVRKTDTLNPTVTVSLYEDGALVSALTTELVTSAVGQIVEGYWDATTLADPTGADVQCFIFGDSNGPSQVEVGAVAWDTATLVGLAEETDSAFAVYRIKRKTAGLNTEADTAFFGGHRWRKGRTIGLATETDTALPVEGLIIVPVGVALETDAALAGTHTKRKAVGLTTEADTALAAKVRRSVGIASEADAALAVARAKVKIVGLATETDTAPPVTRPLNLTVGLANESDSVFSVAKLKRKTVGLCFEYDRSYEVERNISVAWGLKFPLIRPMFRNLTQTWRSKRFPWEDPFDPY
jgi:hypothetical protein